MLPPHRPPPKLSPTPAPAHKTTHSQENVLSQKVMIPIKHDMSATLDGYTNLVIPFPPIPIGVTFHKKQFVVNELLCYLQNKLSEVPFSVLVKITSDYYILEVIKTAKCMCFRLVKVPGHRLISCVWSH